MKHLLFLISIFCFTASVIAQTFSPTDISKLSLWLSSDSVQLNINNVIKWYDKSGNNNHAIQLTSNKQPQKIDSIAELNNKPVIRFNGIDDFMSFTEIDSIRTCFIILKHKTGSSSDNPPILGHSVYYDFYGSTGTLLFGSSYASPYIGNGIVRLNSVNVNAWEIEKPKNYSLLTILSTGNLRAEYITNDRNNYGYWNGDYAEIILYNRALSNDETSDIEQYLRYKYAPPVNLGPDINIAYGFCDTNIHAGVRFTKYLWSTGDTTEFLKVNKSGNYAVTVTDIFGFTSSDSIKVTFPNVSLNINDTTICLRDTITISSSLSSLPGYTYLWSNGSTGSSTKVFQPSTINLTVNDLFGCFSKSTITNVTVDSFPEHISLGVDLNLCSGNNISLKYYPDNPSTLSFLWSDNSTDSLFKVNTTGNYWVRVTNERGCKGYDTIHVNIIGVAPFVDFTADTICFGNPTIFTNSSSLSYDSLKWNFGDGNITNTFSLSHIYNTSGSFKVTLTEYSDICFNTISKSVVVKPVPLADFTYTNSCAGFPVIFTNASLAEGSGAIVNYLWNFAGLQTSNAINPSFAFPLQGNYPIHLTINSSNGCAADTTKIVNTVSTAPLPSITLQSPFNTSLISNNTINFSWISNSAIKYIIDISKDSLFNSLIYSDSTTLNHLIINLSLVNNQIVYWRIKALNYCDEAITSNIFSFSYLNPSSITGNILWLSSDSVETKSGRVKTWYDLSGNNNHAIQLASSNQPQRIDSIVELNNKSVIRFDGIGDFMSFSELDSIRTCFIVFKHATGTSSNYPPILGHSVYYDFIGNTGTLLFNPSYVSDYITNGIIRMNNANANLLTLKKPKNYSILTIVSTGYLRAEYITNDRNNYGYWNGDYAEIILYNRALSNDETHDIEQYLHYKYAPPVNLGADINVSYGFSPVQLNAGNSYAHYQWSTDNPADTLSSLIINKTGAYAVTVTDIFGFVSSDSIKVSYPEIEKLKDTTICLNTTIALKKNLGKNYFYYWLNSKNDTLSKDSVFNISLEDSYNLIIKDTNGYIYRDSFKIKVDSFATEISLGPDSASVCEGNYLSLIKGAEKTKSFLWSDNRTNPSLLIMNPGVYKITVTDINGCSGNDSIKLSIKGKNPSPDFTTNTVCLGDTTFFTDLSADSSSFITNWKWNFGNGIILNINTVLNKNVNHYFSHPGNEIVKLSVTNNQGCIDSISKSIKIYSLPQVNFLPPYGCSGVSIPFTDKSTDSLGTINSWSWNFGDSNGMHNNSNLANPFHIYDTSEIYNVRLSVISSTGCQNSKNLKIQINPSPVINFIFSNTCLGEPTYFTDISQTQVYNQFLEWKWLFNRDTFSTIENPVYVFDTIGNYKITMQTKSLNGCIDSISKSLKINSVPIADFISNNACENSSDQFFDKSKVMHDTITKWNWFLQNIEISSEKNPLIIFTDSGYYKVTLQVETSNGCQDSISKGINVFPKPKADFSFSPESGSPPLTVNFTNLSQGSNSWEWDVDSNTFSTSENPIYVFTENKTYHISQIAKNNYGCFDSVTYPLFIRTALVDIAVVNVGITKINNTLKISAKLINLGSTQITSLDLSASINGGFTIHEMWNGSLEAGDSITYVFTAMIDASSDQNINYVCVNAIIPDNNPDANPDNNQQCLSLVNNFYVFDPYPNPAKNEINIDFILPFDNDIQIILYSLKGDKQFIKNIAGKKGLNTQHLDIFDLMPGIYLYQIIFSDQNAIKKFLKY